MRRVRMNNEKWRAAMSVRRKFVKELLARKTPPKQAQRHLLLALVQGGPHLTRAMTQDNHRYACKLLGLKEPRYGRSHPLAVKAKRASADQALMVSLADRAGRFRTGLRPGHRGEHLALADRGGSAVLRRVQGLGLHPAEVERLVLDPTADHADWPHLQAVAADPAIPGPDADEDSDGQPRAGARRRPPDELADPDEIDRPDPVGSGEFASPAEEGADLTQEAPAAA